MRLLFAVAHFCISDSLIDFWSKFHFQVHDSRRKKNQFATAAASECITIKSMILIRVFNKMVGTLRAIRVSKCFEVDAIPQKKNVNCYKSSRRSCSNLSLKFRLNIRLLVVCEFMPHYNHKCYDFN